MKWLEVIHLRTTEQEIDQLMLLLKQLIDEIHEKGSCQDMKLFKRALLETDVCLQLIHDTEKAKPSGSSIALRITLALKDFGMVNHSVWIDAYN